MMNVTSILKLIPEEELDFLSSQTNVDFQVKKLTGKSMFQLILFSMITSNKASLRIMEESYNSVSFKSFANTGYRTTKYNSIRDRITTINPTYFEKIFHLSFDKFSTHLKEKDTVFRYDSTMVAISSKLIDCGMKVGSKTNKNQIKFTIGMKGSLPCNVEIFKKQEALSEEKTIPKAIINNKETKEHIVLFDRGVQSRKTFEEFTDESIWFVTRAKTSILYTIVSENKIGKKSKNATITIEKDCNVLLKDGDNKWTKTTFRLIMATNDETKEKIYFLSNMITKFSSYEITDFYKLRWSIEVFFKFLKQQLNLTHLVSRNENGIKVMIYMTLIISILIIAYQKLNKLKGYKITILKFANELERIIIKEIVILCGGNPNKMKHLFNDS